MANKKGLYNVLKDNFPANIAVALLLGLITGYFSATYIGGVAGGRAVGTNVALCGNNIREGNEQCDNFSSPCGPIQYSYWGLYPAQKTCRGPGTPGECTFNNCAATERCGDGIRNGFKEQCDPGDVGIPQDLGGLGCADLGFTSGILRCKSICQFNTTSCS